MGRKRKKLGFPFWIGGAVVAAGIGVLVYAGQADAGRHPTPRPEGERVEVVSSSRYQAYPRIAQVYRHAARAAEVIDGLYCYCNCSEHAGHYSLLDCFETDHAARCDVCLSEADLAYDLARDGEDLDAIRQTVDDTFAR